jgi:hypothetical protein
MNQTRWKSAFFIIHPGKIPPQYCCRWKSDLFFKSTGFTTSTFPIQLDFSQNQPAAITLNTGSPRTLKLVVMGISESWRSRMMKRHSLHWSGNFLGIIGWRASCVCKSNRSHVHILCFFCKNWGYSINSSEVLNFNRFRWSEILLESWTSTSYFSNSTG